MMFLFATVVVPLLEVLYCRVNVLDPAVKPVTKYSALAVIKPVLELVPISRTSAVESLAALFVAPEIAKLMDAVSPVISPICAVIITRALVGVVNVTLGVAPPPVKFDV